MLNDYIPCWGCPLTLMSDRGAEFIARVARAAYRMLGIDKMHISAFHPATECFVECTNQTYAQVLSFVADDEQNTWGAWLPHVTATRYSSISQATGLAPNVAHFGRLPRLPFTIL
ncbi:unnamed protein product, partial [Discosporangium mesarthrocarpum]